MLHPVVCQTDDQEPDIIIHGKCRLSYCLSAVQSGISTDIEQHLERGFEISTIRQADVTNIAMAMPALQDDLMLAIGYERQTLHKRFDLIDKLCLYNRYLKRVEEGEICLGTCVDKMHELYDNWRLVLISIETKLSNFDRWWADGELSDYNMNIFTRRVERDISSLFDIKTDMLAVVELATGIVANITRDQILVGEVLDCIRFLFEEVEVLNNRNLPEVTWAWFDREYNWSRGGAVEGIRETYRVLTLTVYDLSL